MAGTSCNFKSSLANFAPEQLKSVISGVPAPEPPSSTPALPKTQAAPRCKAAAFCSVCKKPRDSSGCFTNTYGLVCRDCLITAEELED